MDTAKKKTIRNYFLLIVGVILVYAIFTNTDKFWEYFDKGVSILSPFIVGAVIAFILNVPMRAFERLLKRIKNIKLRRVLALSLTLLAVIMVLAIILPLLVVQLVETYEELRPQLEHFFVTELPSFVETIVEKYPQLGDSLQNLLQFESFDWSGIFSMLGTSISTVFQGVIGAIGSITSGLFNAFIAFAFALYCLFQKETLARQCRKLLYAFFPERVSDYVVRVMRMTNVTFSNFLSGQCIEVVILGIMTAICMAIFGMPHIPLISVVVAITAFIPVVGAWVGCIIGAFLILVSDPVQAVWFVVMFIVLQQIENNLIYPKVVGTSIGLSGMWVLVAVSLGGSLMGVAGMFLMIPMVAVLYAILREITDKRLKKRPVSEDKLRAHPIEQKSKHYRKSDGSIDLEEFDDSPLTAEEAQPEEQSPLPADEPEAPVQEEKKED